jgi:hypothetical protein
LSEELNEIGFGYIWQDPQENSVSKTHKKITEHCNNMMAEFVCKYKRKEVINN